MKSIRRTLTAAFLLLAILIPGIKAVSAIQSKPAPTVVYVVQPGDTLWEIAARVDADRDPRAVVHDLLALNERTSSTLLPGETLRVPAP